MRSFVVAVFALFSLSISAVAQNAAQMAAQQSMQAAQQANQQAMQAAQQANDDAMRANQQAMQAAQQAANSCCGPNYAVAPRFSRKSGSYRAGTTVRLKDSTRGAVMYYTTDGWTPTTQSQRYIGPITLQSTMMLQVIAVAPGCLPSSVASAVYTIPGALPAPLPITIMGNLSPGTQLPFVFTSAVTSKDLQIGDRLPVALAQDLVVGGVVVAPKFTPALTTVMQVDGTGAGGAPGTITFAVHSITLTNGETIRLSGSETTDGRSHATASQSLGLIPWVGIAGLLIHGKPAVIPRGAVFIGYVESGDPALRANAISGPAQQDEP